jgi:YccS/YhfK family integral membrane protein
MTDSVLALSPRRWLFAAGGQPLRVLLALGSVMLLCFGTAQVHALIPLSLGIIASALSETDDSWQGRWRAQAVTLLCFALMAFAIEALFGRPVLFIVGLALAAFALTMLGAIEARFKAIGHGTLILAMYATLSLDHAGSGQPRWHEVALLLSGAAWYGAWSVGWAALFPAEPVQALLVKLFHSLADYVGFKASLFEPVRGVDIERKRLSLAQLNTSVVGALNAAKESIFRRVGPRAPTGRITRYRGLYLIAQDVHERASSSHDDYNALADAFFHSDVLYRCQRVLALQADACRRLSLSIARREPFVSGDATVQALSDLRSAIAHERARADTPQRLALLVSVDALARNLAQLDGQLAGASQPAAQAGRTDMDLYDRSPRSGRDAIERVRRQLTPRSPLFRHAVRLAAALVAGYGLMLLIHPAQGYWILLTTLFVIQPTYGDTMARMAERVAGTALGVVVGWAVLTLFPMLWLQAIVAVAAGVFFFGARARRYLLATAAVTLLVLMFFNQVGDGGLLLWPRLIDTAIGSALAGLAMVLVLPHWAARRINELAAAALQTHAAYLRQIVAQYRSGARDDLAYRLARRNAHNADAALSTAVSDMFREPGVVRPHAGVALRFLIRSHTLLSYVSALGAHRSALAETRTAGALFDSIEGAAAALEALAQAFVRGTPDAIAPAMGQAAGNPVREALARVGQGEADAHEAVALVRTQLGLIALQIDALGTHADEWLRAASPPAAVPLAPQGGAGTP